MVRCNLCSSGNHQELFKKGNYPVVRCRDCGLVFASGEIADFDPAEYYDDGYFSGNVDKRGYQNYFAEEDSLKYNCHREARDLERYRKGGRILDIGCATGCFLEQLGDSWEKHGLEVSDIAVRHARNKNSISIRAGTLEEKTYPADSFDAATMWDVIDHLKDPRSQLVNINNILKKNGLLIIKTGDINSIFARLMKKHWYLMIPPTHLYFFSKETISRMLDNCGFEVLRIAHPGKVASLKLCFYRLSYIFKNRLTDNLRLFFERAKIKNIKIYINFGDVMTIYARKK